MRGRDEAIELAFRVREVGAGIAFKLVTLRFDLCVTCKFVIFQHSIMLNLSRQPFNGLMNMVTVNEGNGGGAIRLKNHPMPSHMSYHLTFSNTASLCGGLIRDLHYILGELHDVYLNEPVGMTSGQGSFLHTQFAIL
jgi:hypothetical protein